MARLTREIEIEASREAVWAVVSDVDNEPEYWHGTREVHNTSRTGNVTERVVVQNFMGTKVSQRVKLNPPDSVEVEYLGGTTVGKKEVTVEGVGPGRERVRVTWDVRFTGALLLITPVIRTHVVKGTENALRRIKEVAEGDGKAPTGPTGHESRRDF